MRLIDRPDATAGAEEARFTGHKTLCRACDQFRYYTETLSGLRYCKPSGHVITCICGGPDKRDHMCDEVYNWI